MSDHTTSPANTDKLVEAFVELTKQTRESKTLLSDVLAQRTQYAADIKDLDASITATRRALDPEALAQHVADNNTTFMGDITRQFGRALEVNLERDRELRTTSATLKAQTDKITSETNFLSGLAARLEERDTRSKWDWVTLAAGMLISAALAGGGAFYFAADQIRANDFDRSIRLITQDDDAYWCGQAKGQIINGTDGSKHCAMYMQKYFEPKPAEGE